MKTMKNYQKPDMIVVELQQKYHLLDPSPGGPDGGAREQRGNWHDED